MKHVFSIIAALMLCASAYGQTVRSLAYNISNNVVIGATNTNALTFSNSFAWSTNTLAGATRTNLSLGWSALTNSNAATFLLGLDTNSKVVTGRTNTIEFSNVTSWGGDFTIGANGEFSYGGTQFFGSEEQMWYVPFTFNNTTNAAATRTNLGLGATWLTNTNVTNFRTAIGLGATNNVEFNELRLGNSGQMHIRGAAGTISFYNGIESENVLLIPADTDPVEINSQWNNAGVRTNLGLPLAALTNTSNVTTMRALAGSTNTNEPFSGTVALTNTNVLTFSNGVLLKIQ